MSTARKILSNTIAQFIGKILVAMLGLAVVKISTNYLSVEGYGEYVLVYEFIAFFGIAADLGLFTVGVREMSKDEKNIPKIIGNVLTLRTVLVFASMILATITVFLIPKYTDTKVPIAVLIASFTTIITILNGTITSVLQAKLKMELASLTSVLGKMVSVGFMAYIVFFGFPTDNEIGFYMLILAGVFGNLVMIFSTYFFVRKITPLEYQFDPKFAKQVLKDSLPYGIALILSTVYFRIDSLLISFIRGQEEVGLYGVAMKMLEHFSVLPLYFMNSVLPTLTRTIEEKKDRYKDIIKQSFTFLSILSAPMVVGAYMLAYPIIFVVADPKFLSKLSEGYYGSDIALQILVFALFFQFLNVLFAFILIAVNKQKKLLYINAACVLFNIISNIIVIPHWGFRGAAITSVLSELFILIANYIYAKRYLDFEIQLGKLVKILFSTLIMGVFIYFMQPLTYSLMENWNLLILIPLAGIIYGLMLFITKTIDKDTLKLFKKV